jgi:hypothetical protein
MRRFRYSYNARLISKLQNNKRFLFLPDVPSGGAGAYTGYEVCKLPANGLGGAVGVLACAALPAMG